MRGDPDGALLLPLPVVLLQVLSHSGWEPPSDGRGHPLTGQDSGTPAA